MEAQSWIDMPISSMPLLVVSLCAMTFAPFMAAAESGRITFSGVVVEPTCEVLPMESKLVVANVSGMDLWTGRFVCGKPSRTSGKTSARYTLTFVRLSNAVPDRLLQYFDKYVRAARPDAVDPTLLTLTYQ